MCPYPMSNARGQVCDAQRRDAEVFVAFMFVLLGHTGMYFISILVLLRVYHYMET